MDGRAQHSGEQFHSPQSPAAAALFADASAPPLYSRQERELQAAAAAATVELRSVARIRGVRGGDKRDT
jgi:hypothetical protein